MSFDELQQLFYGVPDFKLVHSHDAGDYVKAIVNYEENLKKQATEICESLDRAYGDLRKEEHKKAERQKEVNRYEVAITGSTATISEDGGRSSKKSRRRRMMERQAKAEFEKQMAAARALDSDGDSDSASESEEET